MKVSVNRGKENAYLDIMGEEDAGARERKKKPKFVSLAEARTWAKKKGCLKKLPW